MEKKSQGATEFLAIFGIALFFIIVLSGIFFMYSSGAQKTLDRKQLDKTFDEITRNIEKVFFLGEGNRVTFEANLPSGIVNLTILHRNISDPNNPGERLLFDVINVTYNGEKSIESHFYEVKDYYIRFNCSLGCTETLNVDGNWITGYNYTDFSSGAKEIRVESQGDWVSVDFYRGD